MSHSRTTGAFRTVSSFLVVLAAVLLSSSQAGAVTEPNGKTVPVVVSAAEVAVPTSRGFPNDALTLQGLFKYRGETTLQSQWASAAQSRPGAFSPTCGFTYQMMIRGGGCKLDFDWYNATDPPTLPPASDLHVLIGKNQYSAATNAVPPGMACMDPDFCPLATHMTSQVNQHTWTDQIYSSDNIRTDPNYKGGLIGFAIVGDPSSQCTQTHYSQLELNTDNEVNGMPWITALMWQSTVTPDSFYIGFEDLLMSAANWTNGMNDGDFNDFLFFVSGITCKGAGQPCTVPNAIGACAVGKTDCDPSGVGTICRPQYTMQPETCDNIDNDCNGQIDDGATGIPELGCPDAKPYCVNGSCVGNCLSGEFHCTGGLVCDNGHCVDMSCAGVVCTAGLVCHGGACVDACAGAVCPTGQSCTLGRCVDPCNSITCPMGKVCESGACVSPCSCRPCDTGKVCNAQSGKCVDSGCETMTCDATLGQVCSQGTCIDPCQGAVCPGGADCTMGMCGLPNPNVSGTSGTGGGGTVGITGVSAGTSVGISAGTNAGSTAGDTGSTTGTRGVASHGDTASGCSCRTAGSASSRGGGSALALLLGLALARHRARKIARVVPHPCEHLDA